MPEAVLQILKYLFLFLIFLFLARATRAMLQDISGGRVQARPVPAPVAASGAYRAPDKVVVDAGDGTKPRVFPLEDEMIFGRSSKCQVVLSDAYSSQVHARVFKRDSRYFIEDMGSTNGTYLNRRKVSAPAPVSRGDRARIGKTELEFRS